MLRDPHNLRSRLQEIALELYCERGYEGATTAEIAARAGVTERTFFRYFADKREVLFEEDPRLRPTLIAAVARAPRTSSSLDVVHQALRSVEPLFEQNRAFTEPRLQIIAATPALRERAETKSTALTALLAAELEKRGVEEQLAMLAARTGMAAFRHAVQSWFKDPALDLEAYLERAFFALHELTAPG